jgi:hypothetical protein
VAENYQGNKDYDAIIIDEKGRDRTRVEKRQSAQALRGWLASLAIWSLYSPPKLNLDLGQSQISLFLPVADLTSASRRITRIPRHFTGMHNEGCPTTFQLQPRRYVLYV